MSKKRARPLTGDTPRPRVHRPRHARKPKGEPELSLDPMIGEVSGRGPDAVRAPRLAEQVRGTVQEMLDRAVGDRRSVWFG